MTNEMMLTKLMGITPECGVSYQNYEALVEMLKADIRDENNKKAGHANNAKLAKAIIKSGLSHYKYMDPKNNQMAYCKIIDGVQYFLDGYRIAGFFNHMDFPEWESDWYKVDNMINGIEYEDTPLNIPSVAELKAAIKIAKASKKKSIYVFENGICVNSQYLLDFVSGFNSPVFYPSHQNPQKASIYIESPDGFGILLPINTQKTEIGFHEG